MVMHARKLPRLNDGYNGRGQAHHYEDKGSGKGRSSNFNEKFGEKGSPSAYSRHREESPSSRSSPQRYQNKSSYIERERSRLSRVQSNSPGDKRGNYSGAMSSHTNHSSSSKEGRNGRDHKDIQKSAIRVCGDWSEHISSSGKKYYYNFKMEVSQWEKPKEWAPESGKANSRSKDQRSGSSKSGEDRQKHSQGNAVSSSSSSSSRNMDRPSSSHSNPSSSMVLDKYKQLPHPQHPQYKQSQWHSGPDRTRTTSDIATPDRKTDRQHSSGDGSRSIDRYNRGIHDGAITPVNRYTPSSTATSCNSNEHRSRYRDARRINSHNNDDSRHGDDMEISPSSTPTEESLAHHRNKHHHHAPSSTPSSIPTSTPTSSVIGAVAALPQLISQLGENDKSQQRIANQEFTQTAIQTLQKLQEALIAQQRQQQHQLAQLLQQQLQQQQAQINQQQSSLSTSQHPVTASQQQNGSQSPAESEGTPLQSPELNLPEPELKRLQSSEETSSQEGGQEARGRASPAQNQSGAQSISVGGSQLAAAHKKPDSIQLPSSLANYCNEKLIDHVQGWNVAPIEQQADRFAEEAHLVGSIHCTQLSVDLKKARSHVRLTEIRSTLQEQRVLFLRQQIKDLENMRSQNTFMPDT